jgi:2-hydroxychromene-2-carboxylate isomerase
MHLRQWQETKRRFLRRPHQVHVFLQLDDPHSLLLSQCLSGLAERYSVEWCFHLAPPPPDWAMPEREQAIAFALRDCREVASHAQLWCPDDFPPTSLLRTGQGCLLAAFEKGPDALSQVFRAFWEGERSILESYPTASEAELVAHLSDSERLREGWGHYLSATMWMAGEWYWGLDRLANLEKRLENLGCVQNSALSMLAPRKEVQLASPQHSLSDAPPLECFLSLRSPYSYLALPRLYALAESTGVELQLRPILPMVMRGLPVPWAKRKYIVQDSAREARRLEMPFGDICDPLGAGVERGLSLVPLAREQGVLQRYLLAFAEAIWSQGINAATNKGLQQITDRAGLVWEEVEKALASESWREEIESNREALTSLGLWGVPCFRWGEWTTWGQDRLWLVEQRLLSRKTESSAEVFP